MEEPVVKGIVISLVVVLIASLIGILLSLVVVGQSILGGGQNKLQAGLTQIQQQDLQQYSNVTKKGSIVKSAIALYESEPVAILVKTTALHKAETPGATSTAITGQGRYVNYGILLTGASSETLKVDNNETTHMIVDAKDGTSSTLKTLEGQAYLEATLDIQNGVPQANYDTSGTVSTGSLETILDNGVFYCQLIKDKTGTIIGVVFTQQK
jgi:hypothetical protein